MTTFKPQDIKFTTCINCVITAPARGAVIAHTEAAKADGRLTATYDVMDDDDAMGKIENAISVADARSVIIVGVFAHQMSLVVSKIADKGRLARITERELSVIVLVYNSTSWNG